jgi:hypothetical protein
MCFGLSRKLTFEMDIGTQEVYFGELFSEPLAIKA